MSGYLIQRQTNRSRVIDNGAQVNPPFPFVRKCSTGRHKSVIITARPLSPWLHRRSQNLKLGGYEYVKGFAGGPSGKVGYGDDG